MLTGWKTASISATTEILFINTLCTNQDSWNSQINYHIHTVYLFSAHLVNTSPTLTVMRVPNTPYQTPFSDLAPFGPLTNQPTDSEFMYILASQSLLSPKWSSQLPKVLLIERISPHHCLSGFRTTQEKAIEKQHSLLGLVCPNMIKLSHPQTRLGLFPPLWNGWRNSYVAIRMSYKKGFSATDTGNMNAWGPCLIYLCQVCLGFFQSEQLPL